MTVNQCQDPTPAQEAIYERDCEIAALKEQIRDACHLFAKVIEHQEGLPSPASKRDLQEAIGEYIDQNESIVNELNG